ncbi:13031_t:CDS:2, partial [Funneliformis geosporum]
FSGKTDEDPNDWLIHFEKAAKANNWTSEKALEIVEDIHVKPLEISQQEIFDQFIEDNKDICALS